MLNLDGAIVSQKLLLVPEFLIIFSNKKNVVKFCYRSHKRSLTPTYCTVSSQHISISFFFTTYENSTTFYGRTHSCVSFYNRLLFTFSNYLSFYYNFIRKPLHFNVIVSPHNFFNKKFEKKITNQEKKFSRTSEIGHACADIKFHLSLVVGDFVIGIHFIYFFEAKRKKFVKLTIVMIT